MPIVAQPARRSSPEVCDSSRYRASATIAATIKTTTAVAGLTGLRRLTASAGWADSRRCAGGATIAMTPQARAIAATTASRSRPMASPRTWPPRCPPGRLGRDGFPAPRYSPAGISGSRRSDRRGGHWVGAACAAGPSAGHLVGPDRRARAARRGLEADPAPAAEADLGPRVRIAALDHVLVAGRSACPRCSPGPAGPGCRAAGSARSSRTRTVRTPRSWWTSRSAAGRRGGKIRPG